jgi:glycosyltransferase involved in cell wall biosynthesis
MQHVPAPMVNQTLSILIPVFNEIRTLSSLLDAVLATAIPMKKEIVVVDDFSTDGSREVLRDYASRFPEIRLVLHEKNQGKGAAIRTAISEMTGDWALIQDADLEYDPRDYAGMLLPVLDGCADAVFGSRFLVGRYRRAMYFWHTAVNKFLTFLTNILNDLNLTDMETCYKLVRADILKMLIIRSNGFDLEPELTTKLAKFGARIYETPISYRGRTYAEGKKIGAKDAIAALKAIFRYRFFAGRYCNHEGFLILQAIEKANRFNRWLFSQFGDLLGDSVLEAGAGIGNLTQFVLDKPRLVALDSEKFYVDRLNSRFGHLSNVRFVQGDITDREQLLELRSVEGFDSVFCINVLEHIEDDVKVLENFRAVLKPGGVAVILVPHNPKLFSKLDGVLGHCRRYTREELERKMESAGFQIIRSQGFNRVGGLGWRISGRMLGRERVSRWQIAVFERLVPIFKILERLPFHSHNSLVVAGKV